MKKSAKVLAMILVAIFFIQAAPAYAATIRSSVEEITGAADSSSGPQYSNTKDFVDWLDGANVEYRYTGIDSDNDEGIKIDEVDETYGFPYTINFFFDDDEELVSIRVWYVIDFAEEDLMDVMRICNDINYQYRFIKVYVDESDNTVSADMDLIVREGESVGDITFEAAMRMEILLGYAYELLADYAI